MKHLCRMAAIFLALFAFALPGRALPKGESRQRPAAPSHVKAAAASAFQIRLSWKDNSDNETGFKIERTLDRHGLPGFWSPIAIVGADVTTFTDMRVGANTKYWYRVRAHNKNGDSSSSNPASTTTPPRPSAHLTARAVSTSQINLIWARRFTGAAGFKIERAPDQNGSPGSWTQIATVGARVFTYTDTGLVAGTKYWYRVRAFNFAGDSAFSNLASAATLAPSCPISVVGWGDDSDGESTPPIGLIGVVAIAAGGNHSLALKSDGTVVGWGYNYYKQSTTPTNLTDVIAIAAGRFHSLALKNDGTVVGWGLNDQGQATPPTNLTGVVALAAGGYHSLALKGDGTVVGWGNYGEDQATQPTNLTGVVAIAAGGYHSLALKSDGTVVGWGYDGFNQAMPPTNLTGVVAIAAGGAQSLALKNDGTIIGWGHDEYGQATPPANLTGVVAIAAGDWHSLALKGDGSIVGWGNNYNGQVLPGPTGGVAIAAGGSHSLAMTTTPATPSMMRAKAVATNQINLSWLDTSANEDGFKLERAPDDEGRPGIWTLLVSVAANTTNFTDMTVIENATYWYRVRSYSVACGDSLYSDLAAASVAPPTAPFFLSAALGTNQVDTFWNEYFAGVDGFKLERAPDANGNPGTWTEIATVDALNYHDSFGSQSYSGAYSDRGIIKNSTYWYRVRAFNAFGDSPYSDPVMVGVVPPNAPRSVSATAFADQARLGWEIYFGSLDGYKVERAPDVGGNPGAWMEIANVVGSSPPYYYFDTDLPVNTTFWYRVRAYNWVGDSPYTLPLSVTILPPAAPFSLSAIIGTTNQATISWFDYNGDQDGFKIERAPDTDGNPGAWMEIATVNAPYAIYASCIDTNVEMNTTNWYRVRAFNVLGDSPYSDPISLRVVPPDAPFLSANTYRDQVNLSWSDSEDTIGFQLERAPDVAGGPGAWTEIAVFSPVDTTSGSYTDTGRAADTTYWYRVRASSWVGDSPYSLPVSVTIVPPVAPHRLIATVDSPNRVDLSWSDHVGDEDGFSVERAPDVAGGPGTWTEIATFSVPNASGGYYTDTNVLANSTYWYRVRAFNWIGDSPYSDPVAVTVPPDSTAAVNPLVPPQLSGAAMSDGRFVLQIGGAAGPDYAVQVSSNLLDWTTVFVTHSPPMPFSWTDTNAATWPSRFYRVGIVAPPP